MQLLRFACRVRLTLIQHCSQRLASTVPQVCIVGSGPTAFYTAQYLLRRHNAVHVDMFEKLPAPFGLLRYGVAPDHPEVKNLINTFTEVAKNRRFQFVGNVTVGKEIRLRELQRAYSAVILAYGASQDRMLNVPGEQLPGVLSAKKLVGWYNGAPGLGNFQPDLDCETVAIVGMGNVSLDVARILLSPVNRLKNTDIPEPVMAVLSTSRIRRAVLIGRRGPLQVAFTLKEVRELVHLTSADPLSASSSTADERQKIRVRLLPPQVITDTMGSSKTVAKIISDLPRPRRRLTQFLIDYDKTIPSQCEKHAGKFCDFLFLRSPVRIWSRECTNGGTTIGTTSPNADDALTATRSVIGKIELCVNQLKGPVSSHQTASVIPDAPTEFVDCGLVVRSIGYRSVQIDPDLPFDDKNGVIKSLDLSGRVAEPLHRPAGSDASLLFCAGWAKRGAVGVIVDAAIDARETSQAVLSDLAKAELKADQRVTNKPGLDSVLSILNERGVRPISFADWERVDAFERMTGKTLGKPREKLTTVESILRTAFAEVQEHRHGTT
ncbi:NADPH:adrenodoxin oxidoreductase mitochondrial [Fasciola gigantica]|uniref:NADPH:adrenodoxin oxidoreductase, mitochondrial n=1 Tax=Fasciola gigantica TaxID=46835 RepID=A0A504YRJ2_FASGI|nr:NADPH:adrenodoxin oxidoreductase mitochondrial [Fasciola gigantica]